MDRRTAYIKQVRSQGLAFLSAECAWALYERLAAEGKHRPFLLESLVRAAQVPIAIRRKAAQRLAEDIDHVDPKKQNDFLARAINAGARSNRLVTVDPENTYNKEHLLEAAVRQDQKGVKRIIERHLRCRHSKMPCPQCRLLGLLKTPAATEDAWQRTQDCSSSLGDSTIALIWAEDPRAPDALRRLISGKSLMPEGLDVALWEKDSPALRACLENKAKEGNRHAIQLWETLGWKN